MKETVFFTILFIAVFAANAMSEEAAFKKENHWKRDADKSQWLQVVNDVHAVEPHANPSKKGVVIIVKGRRLVRKLETIPRCHDPNVDCFRDVFDQCGEADGCFCVFNGDSMDYCGMYPSPPNTP